jgi:hypothetical protein
LFLKLFGGGGGGDGGGGDGGGTGGEGGKGDGGGAQKFPNSTLDVIDVTLFPYGDAIAAPVVGSMKFPHTDVRFRNEILKT